MKCTVYQDGNGGSNINVMGFGVYVPVHEFQKLERERDALAAQVDELQEIGKVNLAKDFHDFCMKNGFSIYRNEHGHYPPETGKILNAWNAAIELTKSKNHLADHDAEVAKAAFIAGVEYKTKRPDVVLPKVIQMVADDYFQRTQDNLTDKAGIK